MLDWMKDKLESRLLGEISITSDMQMTPSHGRNRRRAKQPPDESICISVYATVCASENCLLSVHKIKYLS